MAGNEGLKNKVAKAQQIEKAASYIQNSNKSKKICNKSKDDIIDEIGHEKRAEPFFHKLRAGLLAGNI